MLLINIFFPVVFVGFDILGNGVKLKDNVVITTPLVEFQYIWLFIFVLQGMFVISQFTPAFRASPMVQMGVTYWYCVVTLLQTLWVLIVPYVNEWASFSVFLLFWLALTALNVFQYYAPSSDKPILEYWLLKFPFGTYVSWISVGLLHYVSVALYRQQFSSEIILAAGMVSLAVWVGGNVFVLFGVNKPFYVIPTVIGLAIASIGSELMNPQDYITQNYSEQVIASVQYTSWSVGCLVLFLTLARGVTQLAFKCVARRKSEVDLARDSEMDEML